MKNVKAPSGSRAGRPTKKAAPAPLESQSDSANGRRIGANDCETRTLLLNAAEELMCEEGYAAVTSRRLGTQAGVNPQLIHYYFQSMDNLFLELWRRHSERSIVLNSQAFISESPIRTLWENSIAARGASLGAELMALARHRKVLKAEIARTAESIRRMQTSALSGIMDKYGLTESLGRPEILTVLIAGMTRILVVEDELGISLGHADTRALIETWIDRFEPKSPSRSGGPKKPKD